jgi:NAD(P)-dependent dehydrogenase (short-subunit alcohol dehydrogenase family)
VAVNGEVVVVTGAARGLGRAYALGLAGEGYAVVVADLADPEPVVDEIVGAGGSASASTSPTPTRPGSWPTGRSSASVASTCS